MSEDRVCNVIGGIVLSLRVLQAYAKAQINQQIRQAHCISLTIASRVRVHTYSCRTKETCRPPKPQGCFYVYTFSDVGRFDTWVGSSTGDDEREMG